MAPMEIQRPPEASISLSNILDLEISNLNQFTEDLPIEFVVYLDNQCFAYMIE